MSTARGERGRSLPAALCVTLTLALVGGASRPARAQTAAAAEALFDEGQALFARGQFAEACEKFAASERTDAATGTLLNLGRCYARIHRNASAWAAFREAETHAHRESDTRREQAARAQAHALEGQLGRLTINVTSPAPGLVVQRDGVVVDPGVFGVAVPADAGSHRLDAHAPGKTDVHLEVVTRDGVSAVVTIPELASASVPSPTPVATVASLPPPPAPAPRLRRDPAYRLGGAVVAGLGVAGLAVGSYFGVRAIDRWHDADSLCNSAHQCSAVGQSDASSARRAADISTVSFIAGGVALAVGAAFFFFAPERAEHDEPARAAFRPTVGPGGLVLPFD